MFVGIIATVLGWVFDVYVSPIGGWFSMIVASLAFMFAAQPMRGAEGISSIKMVSFVTFAFLKGASFGQLISYANFVSPSILATAFFATLAVFTCFSVAAVFAISIIHQGAVHLLAQLGWKQLSANHRCLTREQL